MGNNGIEIVPANTIRIVQTVVKTGRLIKLSAILIIQLSVISYQLPVIQLSVSKQDTDLATDAQMDISVISCQLLVNNTEIRARHRCNIEGVSIHYYSNS
ncbi:MAG: hypothetical protein F6K40_13805 [Okeania sp. SIO3I5]|uniref:hypothetical protein n=1 Tax=Okeania sp. SIO3I5 TaxID=2607805 RepID=UPI0013BC2E2A|nr:hypothetical protein [Okeania sp. SIO3I5]NEQ37284.1 hypothetical protein [Okeania sp. SIO3I5]